MNCCVPELVLEDDVDSFFPSFLMRRIPDSAGEDFFELVWQKGPVFRRRSPEESLVGSAIPSRTEPSASSYSAATPVGPTGMFTEEGEMASWLDYPLGYEDGGDGMGGVGGDYLPEKTPAAAAVAVLDRPFHVPNVDRRADVGGWAASGLPPLLPEAEGKLPLFHRAREPEAAAASLPLPESRDSTVVGLSVTPWLRTTERAPESRVSSGGDRGGTGTLERGFTSSSGVICEGEGAGNSAPRPEDRKRKSREGDDSDYHSEDAEFESSDKKESIRRFTTERRSRAAEVHNLSERRRRDRINEKLKALRQLIPRCNKSDKASMLDDAIEYLKSLQMQVQMMSMGCNMVPMMFPGMQQYMPPMGMAIPMGMSMGMGIGMGKEMNAGTLNHPMMPFMPVMPSSHMVPTGSASLSSRVPMQPFHAQALAISDQMKLQATGQTDPAANLACLGASSSAKIPCHLNPCQQCARVLHSQVQVHHQPQNQAVTERGTRRGVNMPEKSEAAG